MSIILALLLGALLTLALQRRLPEQERRYMWMAYGAHIVGTAGLLWLAATRGGDMDGYAPRGMLVAELIRNDPARWGVQALRALVRLSSTLPIDTTTAGAMQTYCALTFLLVGDSFYGASLAVGFLSLGGQALMYGVLRQYVPANERRYVALGFLLTPSVTFWTSGLVKEAFSVWGMGMLVWGFHSVAVKRSVVALIPAAAGAIIVGGVKPYILFPLVVGLSGWIFASRGKKLHLGYAILAIIVGIVGVAALGSLFPEFGVEKLGESLSAQRYYSEQAGGGSITDEIDTATVAFTYRDTSMVGQLKYLPIALLNALLRPFLFEVRNIPQFAAAVETTAIVVILVRLMIRTKLATLYDATVRSPVLLASSVFVVTFAASVGLAALNLGTLSRYRVPMMPSYITLILILRHRFRSPAEVRALAGMPLNPQLAAAVLRRRQLRDANGPRSIPARSRRQS